jgi:next-to-BRCA1 protein 1
LCASRPYAGFIVGDRYKCAICHDTDFCANCEALPTSLHNRTHPLIKFRTPLKSVSITTFDENENGEVMKTSGDRVPHTSSKATETTPAAPSANAATQVQTIAEVKPMEPVKFEPKTEVVKTSPPMAYEARFVRDTICDGTVLPPDTVFQQVWTLRNPGPIAWPAGFSLRFIGGDRMLDIDLSSTISAKELEQALSSNAIDRAVEVGEEVDFEVTLKTPSRPGKAISYWHLKSPDGVPCVGSKLWCDIDVKVPSKTSEDIPIRPLTDATAGKGKDNSVKDETEDNVRHSQMIFPTLDKESPHSSTHDVAEQEGAHSPATSPSDNEFFEEVESIDFDGESSEDCFLTDEEYDILENDYKPNVAINGKA